PACPEPHILVAFNAPSIDKFGPTVQPGGAVLYDSTVISTPPSLDPSIRVYGVPFTQIATDLGKRMVKNVVALGALRAASDLFPRESFLGAMRETLQKDCAMLELNEEAFTWGERSLGEMTSPASG
ncbi:MAG: 2-oxoacid:acceptor oxidoreductase family protein, partial [Gemmatimonadota bacterium]|nr:2-oxoacid:acceptor oxidoreductase family protein [Gemmatimonadota bacterium]